MSDLPVYLTWFFAGVAVGAALIGILVTVLFTLDSE